ncbi:MAG: cation:proton antiporter, partial [Gammaproteobacteria bacterium]
VMIVIGYFIGQFFHWTPIDSLFLGAMIAISSTTIVVKALNELGFKKEKFVQLIFGILIVEDILAIAILALLSSIATNESVNLMNVIVTLSKLLLFLIVSLTAGILVVPRLIAYVAKFNSHEMLLITVLGLCFGFCLLVTELGYSIVLGAFIMGAIIAESAKLATIQKLIEPLRDMFSAVFFVAIGLMLDPHLLIKYWAPILVITIAVVFGKVITCAFGAFITGRNGRTSLRVGMGLAQIGEFSFIIAAFGMSVHIIGNFLYPVAVSVSALTTILTPYLIRSANPLAAGIAKFTPQPLVQICNLYTSWLRSIRLQGDSSAVVKIIRINFFNIFINLAMVAAIFIILSYVADYEYLLKWKFINATNIDNFLWLIGLIISLPFLIVSYRKIKLLSRLLVRYSHNLESEDKGKLKVKRFISEIISALAMVGIMLFVFMLSTRILPSTELLATLLIFITLMIALLWRWFVRMHVHLKNRLIQSIKKHKE